MTRHDGIRSLLHRLWGVPGAILVASVLAATSQVGAVDAIRLACGPLLIGLGG
jgi:hypothetical protein